MANSNRVLQVPCSLIYGESDWMNPEAGKKILGAIQEERGKLSTSDLQVTHNCNACLYLVLVTVACCTLVLVTIAAVLRVSH